MGLVLCRVPDAVSEMLGCPASKMASPLPLPAAPATLLGKEEATRVVMEVTAGSGGHAEGPAGWDGGAKGGEREANKSCIE